MKPLDLTKTPPRSPREQLVGLVFIPRMIDKMRALLPGGNPGKYHDGLRTLMRTSSRKLRRRRTRPSPKRWIATLSPI
jgi:hypothetical protein